MRIAFFTSMDPSRIDGVSVATKKLAAATQAIGHQATIFSTNSKVHLDATSADPITHIDQFRSSDFNVAVFGGCFDPGFWRMAAECRSAGLPYVVSPHGSLVKAAWRRSTVKKLLALPILYLSFVGRSAATHFLCDEERDNSLRIGQAKSFVCPNVQETSEALPVIVAKRNVIGFLGRLDVSHKGLDILLAAVARVKPQLRNAGYVVELVGPDFRGGVAKLRELIEQLDLAELVRILPPKVGEEKARWLSEAAIFVHCSRHEGQPQAVFEAMMAGAEPVISDGCNMTSIVAELGYGAVVRANEASVSAGLLRVIADRRTASPENLDRLFRRYEADQVGSLFASNLHKIMGAENDRRNRGDAGV